jgi:orotate phosphoribosyltransferase-like protein
MENGINLNSAGVVAGTTDLKNNSMNKEQIEGYLKISKNTTTRLNSNDFDLNTKKTLHVFIIYRNVWCFFLNPL